MLVIIIPLPVLSVTIDHTLPLNLRFDSPNKSVVIAGNGTVEWRVLKQLFTSGYIAQVNVRNLPVFEMYRM